MSAGAARVRQPRFAVLDGLDPAAIDAEYAADRWRADQLGFDALAGRDMILFDRIVQPWLRDAAKAWCRWRLATGLAWASASAFALAISRFSQFLAACEPHAVSGAVITRPLLERYISWLTSTHLAANSRSLSLIALRGFLEHNRRHRWLPEVPATAIVFQDDLPVCCPPSSMSMTTTRSMEMASGRAEAPAACRLHRVVDHSAVISVTAARAEDSSTMAFLAA